MSQYSKQFNAAAQSVQYDSALRAYMLSVYNYMAVGLGITGLVSYAVSQSEGLMQLFFGTPLQWLVMFAPLAMAFFVMPRMMSFSLQGAQMLFWSFAAAMGLSLSTIFLAYTAASITNAFLIAASIFGAMSIYGYTTKKDLTSMGSFMIMGVFGMIIASLVNMFLQSPGFSFAISAIGVVVFTALVAYDVQRVKSVYYAIGAADQETASKIAIYGALNLYMDFINLFLSLLRFVGDRR